MSERVRRDDIFLKVLLTFITVGLWIVILRPLFLPSPAVAQQTQLGTITPISVATSADGAYCWVAYFTSSDLKQVPVKPTVQAYFLRVPSRREGVGGSNPPTVTPAGSQFQGTIYKPD
jgi:hypothetical protein